MTRNTVIALVVGLVVGFVAGGMSQRYTVSQGSKDTILLDTWTGQAWWAQVHDQISLVWRPMATKSH
jgi:hypothetical protein